MGNLVQSLNLSLTQQIVHLSQFLIESMFLVLPYKRSCAITKSRPLNPDLRTGQTNILFPTCCGNFILAREDLGESFDESFPACALKKKI